MIGFFGISLIAITAILLLYYYCTVTYNFWKTRGVRGPKPVPLIGNTWRPMLRQITVGEYIGQLYNDYKTEPVVGVYSFREPILVANDPEVIKTILIKDFSKFAGRGMLFNEKIDPLGSNLFLLEVERWRPLRLKLSPTFTSGKLKEMFTMIADCSTELETYIKKIYNSPVEICDLTARFATDVIGSCVFGVEANALKDKDSHFRRIGKRVVESDNSRMTRLRLQQFAPFLADLYLYFYPDNESDQFFIDFVMNTIKYRKEHNIVRHDFINTLMELCDNPDKIEIEITDQLLAAQAFVFFAAGFETSSTTMSHALYELAQNHEVQNKLREEITESYAKHKSDLRYENIKEMQYLDAIFKETLRKYPVGSNLIRMSTCDYTFEDLNFSVPKGQRIWIPVHGLHHDPNVYPNPELFDPERFSSVAVANRHPMYYLPFGAGPRNCIATRFADYETKIGLIQIIRNFKVDICEKTQIPYEADRKSPLLVPRNGMYLKITEIDKE